MKAAYYERVGLARDVLIVGELPDPEPGPGEVRVRVEWSGVNPSDVKSRSGRRASEMPFPRVVPHSDGSGIIDRVGPGVPESRVGQRVWTWNAAWGRPFGTAATFVALPTRQAVALPDGVMMDAVAPVIGAASTLLFELPPYALMLYLGFFAGFLLYIGISDILPQAHSKARAATAIKLIGLTALGSTFVFVSVRSVA